MAWNIWQRPDGRRVNIELVGLDNGNAGGPWKMRSGDVDAVHRPDNVLVDELYADALGVRNAGEMVEILGTRAIVGGLTRDVRTFTASPFVFTSIASAIKYDKRYSPDEVTYVLARCAPNTLATTVKNNVAQALPEVDVLTTREFALKTVRYWMLETGVGITVVLTAALGICIGAIITTQTVFSITHDHLHDYTTLLAIGFMHRALRTVVFHQSILLGAAGIIIGTIIFIPASIMSMRTSIPIETTPAVFAGLAFLYLTICVGASFVSVREIYKIDPVAVFTR
jgi:putative ABC transport system permease protein